MKLNVIMQKNEKSRNSIEFINLRIDSIALNRNEYKKNY